MVSVYPGVYRVRRPNDGFCEIVSQNPGSSAELVMAYLAPRPRDTAGFRVYGLARTRARSSGNPARPYIDRLTVFSRFT
jgi:hypothetical protein